MKPKFVFIGGDSRSGGSLLARLFDFPNDFLSYHLEHEYFSNRIDKLFDFKPFLSSRDLNEVYDKEVVIKLLKFADGKLTSKQFYDKDSLSLDRKQFETALNSKLLAQGIATESDVYEAIAIAFFETFYGEPLSPKLITNHCARAFLADLDRFFTVFTQGYFIHTIREPLSFAASLKNYSYVILGKHKESISPEFMQMINERWVLGLWHALRNKMKFGERYLLVSYEALVKRPAIIMQRLCDIIDVPFQQAFTVPSMGKELWSGNSSFGALPQSVSESSLTKYMDSLNETEITQILNVTQPGLFDLEDIIMDANVTSKWNKIDSIARNLLGQDYETKLTRDYFISLNANMTKLQVS